ncbi:Transcription initiation factor TFIIIB, Brf1 subunit/Transcription initiation factor TFIIB [Halogranum rubrum]|uniref:Transcription initiation factor TFIIIB, Brf1 subunit/Transcription initiation factor TFIIB n=1 Tax=Halogranum rubrum TaxID=553466 RepID=A0A1I4FVN0_9EURY|nr:transcription initiation factor IIB family protein [Halogranum rubrum]SFL21593.1 Transcription initiation factor TFIIIB, Brf1 subunit/Transcription initiation factor TFIIB [Halogranum rubrum]
MSKSSKNEQLWLQNPSQTKHCPSCDSIDLDCSMKGIDAICNACGFLIRSFANIDPESIPNNRGSSEADDEANLSWFDYCKVSNSTESQIAAAISVLDAVSDKFDIPDNVRVQTAELYGAVAIRNFTDGRLTESIVGSLIYLVARKSGNAIPLSRVAEHLELESSRLDRLVRLVQQELGMEHAGCLPEDYLVFLCATLGYSEDARLNASELLCQAHTAGITNGRNPVAVAGAALYCSSGRVHSQQEVAKVAGVSKETIRVRIREFRDEGLIDE